MELNRRDYGLAGLRIGYTAATESVEFRLDLPPDVQTDSLPGPPVGPSVPASALGLPASLPVGDMPDHRFALPPPLQAWIAAHDGFAWLSDHRGKGLWLNVRSDHPLLPMAPWERLFAEAGVVVPVLRLPGYLGRPAAPPKQPRVALWMTMPAAKTPYSPWSVVERILVALRQLPVPPVLHVFTDSSLADSIQDEVPDAIVHDPTDVPDAADGLGHPWLQWMERSLTGRSVHVLHLVGHGYLSADQPGFATAESPTINADPRWARFAWPNEIAGTMTRIGAFGAVVTAVPGNYSTGSLRLMASRLASHRGGPAVFDDMDVSDPDRLSSAYRLLLAHPAAPPRDTRGMAVTAHPRRFGIDTPPSTTYEPTEGSFDQVAESGDESVPDWVAPVQAQVATWETRLSMAEETPRMQAFRNGLELTKQRLDAMLAESGTVGAEGGAATEEPT